MKKWNRRKTAKNTSILVRSVLAAAVLANVLAGCGKRENTTGKDKAEETEPAGTEMLEDDMAGDGQDMPDPGVSASEEIGIGHESAKDAQIDFEVLKKENPEIFAWLYVPDTSIDAPILQSMAEDDYYETHNAEGEADEGGAFYIEAANLASMCDFNTVIHGRAASKEDGEGLFDDLYRFADPDFFDSHEQFYIYLEDNVLTYEVFAAYERENTSLIREYDFTYLSGCEQFLEDMYSIREMAMMIRAGWLDVTPYHFLVTLTAVKEDDPESQFVVLGALIDDPAGNIDREVTE